MNKNDYAVVVGIRHYPGITHLSGPLNDADDFVNWLRSETGGNMPNENIISVRKEYADHEVPGIFEAEPTKEGIKSKFDQLNRNGRAAREAYSEQELAQKNISFYRDPTDNKLYYGRRLYLFFAGHGFNDKNTKTSISMLAANGDYKQLISNGVNAFHCLEFYEKSGYFKEVVLITDCCRIPKIGDDYTKILTPPDPAPTPRMVRTVYMLSCQDGEQAREDVFDGKCNGIFSKLLLEALQGAKSDTNMKAVTFREISSYIQNNRHRFKGEQSPVINGNEEGMLVRLVERTNDTDEKFRIRFKFPEKWIGGTITISTHNDNEVLVNNFAINAVTGEFDLPLEILCFKVITNEKTSKGLFEITSSNEEIDLAN